MLHEKMQSVNTWMFIINNTIFVQKKHLMRKQIENSLVCIIYFIRLTNFYTLNLQTSKIKINLFYLT